MTFIQNYSTDFETVAGNVKTITDTEHTFLIKPETEGYDKALELANYSFYGFKTLGATIGFPAQFVMKLAQRDPDLAAKIVRNCADNYFLNEEKPEFYGREFLGKIQGCVSKSYRCFDDNEVVDILAGSPLSNLQFEKTVITPERLHLRALDKEPFRIDGDDSNLFIAFFIDNSMVGQSSFRVRLGLFRQMCSNGLIVSAGGEFTICKQIHKGQRDIAAEFNTSLSFLSEKKEAIIDLIKNSANAPAAILSMKEEYRKDYLTNKLNLNKKEAEKVLTLFAVTYGGKSRWGMANAITEFARDVKDINRRTFLESKALAVA